MVVDWVAGWIILGIIIDAFGASRDNRHDVDQDQGNSCFICGIESAQFDRVGSFNTHYKLQHNMWNYVFFMAHLKLKDENDYIGQESYVAVLVEEHEISFFPIERALMLDNANKEKEK